jgi:hypothetical protein
MVEGEGDTGKDKGRRTGSRREKAEKRRVAWRVTEKTRGWTGACANSLQRGRELESSPIACSHGGIPSYQGSPLAASFHSVMLVLKD